MYFIVVVVDYYVYGEVYFGVVLCWIVEVEEEVMLDVFIELNECFWLLVDGICDVIMIGLGIGVVLFCVFV